MLGPCHFRISSDYYRDAYVVTGGHYAVHNIEYFVESEPCLYGAFSRGQPSEMPVLEGIDKFVCGIGQRIDRSSGGQTVVPEGVISGVEHLFKEAAADVQEKLARTPVT